MGAGRRKCMGIPPCVPLRAHSTCPQSLFSPTRRLVFRISVPSHHLHLHRAEAQGCSTYLNFSLLCNLKSHPGTEVVVFAWGMMDNTPKVNCSFFGCQQVFAERSAPEIISARNYHHLDFRLRNECRRSGWEVVDFDMLLSQVIRQEYDAYIRT